MDNPGEIGGSLDLGPEDIFRPNAAAIIDDTRTWVDPNGYRLSDRLWRAKAADRKAIDNHLRQALAAGKSPLATARGLDQYLNPYYQLRRDPETFRVLPIGKQPKGVATKTPRQGPGRGPARPRNSGTGGYSARRLARTETTRAFGDAAIKAAQANPLVRRMKWRLSSHHHDSDQCDMNAARSSTDCPRGVYLIDELPRYPDHPHEMCSIGPYVTQEDVDSAIPRLREYIRTGEMPPLGFIESGLPLAPFANPSPAFSGRMDIAGYKRTPEEAMKSAFDAAGGRPGWDGNTEPEWRFLSDSRYTDDERQSLLYYKGSGYGGINDLLRGKPRMLPDDPVIRETYRKNIEERITHIDSAFSKAEPLTEPIRVRRDSYIDFIGVSDQQPGNLFIDDGYVSTSAHPKGAGFGHGLTMDIYVPPGVRVIPTDEMTSDGKLLGEAEVLLPRGTTFRVVSTDPANNTIVLEVLP